MSHQNDHNSETISTKRDDKEVVNQNSEDDQSADTIAGSQRSSGCCGNQSSEISCCSSGTVQSGNNAACCGGTASDETTSTGKPQDCHWIIGEIKTPGGNIPQISTTLTFRDTLGSWKVRWGINRMNYKVDPGLYAVGNPDKNDPVLVTANYKLTFDAFRKQLSGLNAWVLVLDTKGVNVWCAAGKGTFGTDELVNRIFKTKLYLVVSHRKLILPQLGAPGIRAHEIKDKAGFLVKYGPVRTADIKAFLRAGLKATPEMRMVGFNAYDRLVLTPVELVGTIKPSLMVFGILFILNLLAVRPFGVVDFYGYIGAIFVGCVLTPVLLPLIPGRAFAWKGWILGLIWALAVNLLNGWPQSPEYGLLKALGYCLVFPAMAAYFAMNFTGASTYTSLSGVLKEMKRAVPLLVSSLAIGILLLLVYSLIPV